MKKFAIHQKHCFSVNTFTKVYDFWGIEIKNSNLE